MKTLFLDIDGVLVNRKTINEHKKNEYRGMGNFDPFCVHLLNWILDQTGAELVLSSSWRLGTPKRYTRVLKHIEEQGVRHKIIDRTPDPFPLVLKNGDYTGQWSRRGAEIQLWLKNQPETIDKFAILDDNSDMEPLMPFLVKTDFEKGLDQHAMDPLLTLLGRNTDVG